MELPIINESDACSCSKCNAMCRRPCWPLPSEVRALIEAGEGNRLMLDYWRGDFSDDCAHDNTYIVCPANPGHEGTAAPESGGFGFMFSSLGPLHSGCVFHENALCQLHDRGLKPLEGRAAHHALDQPDLHENVARYWDTEVGREVVALWCALVGETDPYERV